jgi:hypothetical protein
MEGIRMVKRLLLIVGLVLAVPLVMADTCGSGTGGAPAGGQPANPSSGSTAQKVVAIGTEMKASSGEAVTVTGFKANTGATDFSAPPAGKQCIQITFTIVNGSSKEWLDPVGELNVVDSNGQKYDSFAIDCANGDQITSLVAGGHATATEYFEVPTGLALDAVWQPNFFETTVFQTKLA